MSPDLPLFRVEVGLHPTRPRAAFTRFIVSELV